MKPALLCILLLLACMVRAQDSSRISRPRFQSINMIGFMEGESGTGFQAQTINGFRLNRYFAGAGIGLDSYGFRSIPLFLDLRTYLFSSRNPFIYLAGGRNFPWEGKTDEWASDYNSGWFYDLGVGYSLPLKAVSVLFSGGYSFKTYQKIERYPGFCPTPPCPEDVYHYDYKLRRISVRMGVSF